MPSEVAYAPRSSAMRPERPLRVGLSIGHPSGTCGTLGLFVEWGAGKRGFLTAASVAAPKGARPGDFIHQPSLLDVPRLTGATRAGMLSEKFTTELGSGKNWGDAAVVELLEDPETVRNEAPFDSPFAGGVIPPTPLSASESLDAEVVCFGRAGATLGRVAGQIDVRIHSKGETLVFADCLDVRGDGGGFSFRGDGGALVCRRKDLAPIGLVFASAHGEGDETRTYVFELAKALEIFELRLL